MIAVVSLHPQSNHLCNNLGEQDKQYRPFEMTNEHPELLQEVN